MLAINKIAIQHSKNITDSILMRKVLSLSLKILSIVDEPHLYFFETHKLLAYASYA